MLTAARSVPAVCVLARLLLWEVRAARKREQQIERIQKLPKSHQRFVMEMLETVLRQADR